MKFKKPVLTLLSVVTFLLFLFIIQDYIILITTCILVSYVAQPFYKRLLKVLKHDSIAAFITEILFISVLVYLIFFIVTTIINVSTSLIGNNFLNSTEVIVEFITSNAENPFTRQGLGNFWNIVREALISAPEILLKITIFFFATFFLIKDYDKIIDYAKSIIPSRQKRGVSNFFLRVNNMIKEIIYGHFLSALIIGLLTFVLLTILGNNNAANYAVFSTVLSLIPLIGSWIIPLFLSVMYWINGEPIISAVFVIYAFLISYLYMMIEPIVAPSKETIHPLLFVLGLAVGFKSFGLFGFFLGPIVFGILQIGIDELLD